MGTRKVYIVDALQLRVPTTGSYLTTRWKDKSLPNLAGLQVLNLCEFGLPAGFVGSAVGGIYVCMGAFQVEDGQVASCSGEEV